MGNIPQKITLNTELRNIWKFITSPENFPKYAYGYAHGKNYKSKCYRNLCELWVEWKIRFLRKLNSLKCITLNHHTQKP